MRRARRIEVKQTRRRRGYPDDPEHASRVPSRCVEPRIERTAQRDADLKARAISGQHVRPADTLRLSERQ